MDIFNDNDHNSYMMLGLLNTLTNAGILPKKDRDDILSLGEIIKGYAVNKENTKHIKEAKKLVKELELLKL